MNLNVINCVKFLEGIVHFNVWNGVKFPQGTAVY